MNPTCQEEYEAQLKIMRKIRSGEVTGIPIDTSKLNWTEKDREAMDSLANPKPIKR